MLQIFTVPEALAELDKRTGSSWSESMLYDAALRHGVELRAAPPRSTKVALWRFEIGEGLVQKMSGLPWSLAVVFPQGIAELWQTGETEVMHAARAPMNEGDLNWFEEPVVVRRGDVRVTASAIEAILSQPSSATAIVEKPIETRERNTLLCIIAALCKEAGYDYNKAAKTASNIASTAAGMGLQIGETTIENHLKKITDALGSRMK